MTTYESNIIYSFITNINNYISKLKLIFPSKLLLLECCKTFSKELNKFVIEFNNISIDNNRNIITTKEELEEYAIGSLISYMTINGNFRSGGFIIKFCEDYFIYIMPDFVTKYRARYVNISEMWIGDVYTTRNDIVSIVSCERKKTKFSIIINDVIIFSGSEDNCSQFKHGERYEMITNWCTYFNNKLT